MTCAASSDDLKRREVFLAVVVRSATRRRPPQPLVCWSNGRRAPDPDAAMIFRPFDVPRSMARADRKSPCGRRTASVSASKPRFVAASPRAALEVVDIDAGGGCRRIDHLPQEFPFERLRLPDRLISDDHPGFVRGRREHHRPQGEGFQAAGKPGIGIASRLAGRVEFDRTFNQDSVPTA